MSCSGDVHVVGRKEYGRLGLGKDEEPKSFVRLNTEGFQVKSVATGGSVSFAVTEDGLAYAWGMGSNLQLGSGNEDDQWVPNKVTGKQLKGQKVTDASLFVGGQHSSSCSQIDISFYSKFIFFLHLYTCISHCLVVHVNRMLEIY